jgi:hypothetical protein
MEVAGINESIMEPASIKGYIYLTYVAQELQFIEGPLLLLYSIEEIGAILSREVGAAGDGRVTAGQR